MVPQFQDFVHSYRRSEKTTQEPLDCCRYQSGTEMYFRSRMRLAHHVIVILLAVFLSADCRKLIHSFAGPYIVYTKRFYLCHMKEPGPALWTWHLRTSHFNPLKPHELQRLTGNVTGRAEPLDDRTWVRISVDSRSNNQWKENALVFPFNSKGCSQMRANIPDVSRVFFHETSTDGPCSVPPGVYEVSDEPVAWRFPNFPIMPYGEYRFRLAVGRDNGQYGCWVVEGVVIPEP